MDYYELIKNLPLPTEKQCEQFTEDFCAFHSWYKHLSLIEGNKFVFFLNPDVASVYDEEHPRMHYGWKTASEYREKYGFLDYRFFEPGDEADIILSNDEIHLPSELMVGSSVLLYPFVSNDMNAIESINYGIYDDDLALLAEKSDHPFKNDIFKWKNLQDTISEQWYALNDEEKEQVIELADTEVSSVATFERSEAVKSYLETDDDLLNTYNEAA